MLDAIYGIGRQTAENILAETGVDMSRWPSHRHIASWAKICPGNHDSAGKRHSGRTGKGNRLLRGILVEASVNVTRKSDSYYAALYHRIAARRGKKPAQVAVAHSLLVASTPWPGIALTAHGRYSDVCCNVAGEDAHSLIAPTPRALFGWVLGQMP